MDDEEKKLMEHYQHQVQWLRERVPPDDIYDFAQQMIISAENILFELGQHTDLQALMDKDPILKQWIDNVMSIHFMKAQGFTGIINTSVSFRKE